MNDVLTYFNSFSYMMFHDVSCNYVTSGEFQCAMPMLTSMSDTKVPWPVRPHSFGAVRTGRALVKLVGLGGTEV